MYIYICIIIIMDIYIYMHNYRTNSRNLSWNDLEAARISSVLFGYMDRSLQPVRRSVILRVYRDVALCTLLASGILGELRFRSCADQAISMFLFNVDTLAPPRTYYFGTGALKCVLKGLLFGYLGGYLLKGPSGYIQGM